VEPWDQKRHFGAYGDIQVVHWALTSASEQALAESHQSLSPGSSSKLLAS